jgi:tetratricopeptide (TPR) repeat protein
MAGRDEARARACFTDAARLFKSVGDRRQVALMLDNLAGFEFVAGRYGEAAGLLDEALLLARGAGDVELTATILCDIGDLLLADGRAAEARERFGEALVAARRRGLQFATGHALLGFAGVAAATEAPEVAARLIGASTGYLEYGLTTHINDQLHQRTRKAAIEQIGEAAFEAQRLLGELMDFEDAVRLAADSYGERAGAGAAQPDAYT